MASFSACLKEMPRSRIELRSSFSTSGSSVTVVRCCLMQLSSPADWTSSFPDGYGVIRFIVKDTDAM
jgi:hypothetical protein